MSEERMCPHCPNMIKETDTTCPNCGEGTINHLAMLAARFGIPLTPMKDGVEHILIEIVVRAEGIEARYFAPGQVEEAMVQGELNFGEDDETKH